MARASFMFILLLQLLFLCVSIVICSVSWNTFIPGEVQELEAANVFLYHMGIRGMMWEFVSFVLASILLRVCIQLQPKILLILSLLCYTISGTFLVCHVACILICSGDEGEGCTAMSPSTIRGQNAVFISVSLIFTSFFIIHILNYYTKVNVDDIVLNTIIQNSLFILFVACGSICIIDDNIWDWKYAYSFLFTLGITTYINSFSAFILVSNHNQEHDMWQTASLVFLQPLLFVEESIRICLTT